MVHLGRRAEGDRKRYRYLSLRGSPFRLQNIGNKLYQCHTYGIRGYDARPSQVKGIQRRGDIGLMYDVCDMLNGDLMVASVNGLYHITADGKY